MNKMAEVANTVEIIEVCMVDPAVLDPSPVPTSLPFTFFDLRWLRLISARCLYFYEMSTPEAFFHTNILPRLKHSLSLTLGHHFLPLAGKLTWPSDSPKPVLTYSPGDAISLTVARSYSDFSLLTGTDNFICDATICHPLAPDFLSCHEQSTVSAIQITVFPNRGFAIGITNDHLVLDGKSFDTFMKSWAYICRSLGVGGGDHVHEDQHSRICLPADLEPFYDRTLINDTGKLEALFSSQLLNFEGPNNRSLLHLKRHVLSDSTLRGTFQLTREKLEKLRRRVKVNKNNQHDHDQNHDHDHFFHVSTFSLACAYTWVCLVKAEGIKDKKVVLSFPIDCRPRLEPPLPRTYFGNCVATAYAAVETEFLLGKEGLSIAVNSISEAIRKLDNGVLEGAEDWVLGAMGSSSTPTLGRVFPVALSHRFGFYKTDFGWGQPRKFNSVSKNQTGLICLSDRRNGDGGVEIGLVLKKHHMEAFTSLFVEGLESL